jgi:hypothetical protein
LQEGLEIGFTAGNSMAVSLKCEYIPATQSALMLLDITQRKENP